MNEHPGRVLAVYIRNVSHDASRIAEIEQLATVVAATGSSLVLAPIVSRWLNMLRSSA